MIKQPIVTGVNEQETSINFARGDEKLSLYTSDLTIITKLKAAGWPIPEKDFAGGITVEVPVSLITFRTFKEKKEKSITRGQHMKGRKLSEEHKAKLLAGRKARKEGLK